MTKSMVTYTSILQWNLGEKIVTQDWEGYMPVGNSRNTDTRVRIRNGEERCLVSRWNMMSSSSAPAQPD